MLYGYTTWFGGSYGGNPMLIPSGVASKGDLA